MSAEASELSTLATAAESLSTAGGAGMIDGSRAPSLKRSSSNGATPSGLVPPNPPPLARQASWSSRSDWHLFMTIEERQSIRNKIKEAYSQRCPTYTELLETCVAIEEELLYISTPSRLDYFKSGMQYEKRVQDKRKQLSGQVQSTSEDEKSTTEKEKPSKRGRH